MKPAAIFMTGALAFGGAQAAWSVARAHDLVRGTWMMKTGGGILTCMALFVVVATVAFSLRGKDAKLSDGIVAMEAGAMVALAIALVITGPGGLWPLVLVLDGVLIGCRAFAPPAVGPQPRVDFLSVRRPPAAPSARPCRARSGPPRPSR